MTRFVSHELEPCPPQYPNILPMNADTDDVVYAVVQLVCTGVHREVGHGAEPDIRNVWRIQRWEEVQTGPEMMSALSQGRRLIAGLVSCDNPEHRSVLDTSNVVDL